MPSLDDLRQIVERSLQHVVMTDEQKNAVRRRTADTRPAHAMSRRFAILGTAAVAACLALVLLFSYGIPKFSAAGTTLSDTTAAATTRVNPSATTGVTSGFLPNIVTPSQALTVCATDASGTYISADTTFLITGITDSAELSSLKITPEVDFTLTTTDKGIALSPSTPLSKNTVYKVSIDSDTSGLRTWAFQTASSLSVVNTIPANLSSGFSLDTGIEITFSLPVSDADACFSISPAVDGRFEYDGHTMIFIPAAPLAANTVYTVTLQAGLPSQTGSALESDYSFSFRTLSASDTPYLYLVDSFTESYLPSDPLAITLRASDSLDDIPLRVDVYALDSADEYLSLAAAHEAAIVPSIGVSSDVILELPSATPDASFQTTLSRPENNYWDTAYLVFPETLPVGYYLVDVTPDGTLFDTSVRFQKLIQVSDLTVYAETLNGDALIWANSSVTGNPCSNIEVTLNAASSVTNELGYTAFDIGAADTYADLRIDADTVPYVDYIPVSGDENSSLSASYYTFLYTDRSAYLPSDTLCFWGRILPRTSDALVPVSIDLYLDGIDDGTPDLTLSVAADGTFTGSLDFTNLLSYNHSLDFAVNGESLLSQWFYVTDYTKPAYVLTVAADQGYYYADDTVTLTATGTFYDGTPAEGLEVVFYHGKDVYGNYESAPITLDKNGQAVYTFTPAREAGTWYPETLYCSVDTSGAEDVWVSAYTYVPYFRSDTMLTLENLSDTGAELQIRSNAIDFSSYDPQSFGNLADTDTIRGEEVVLDGTYTITRCEYIPVSTGRTYDYINKVSVETYDYNYVETTAYTGSFRTEGGVCTLPEYTLSYDNCAWYTCTIEAVTADGATLRETLYLSSPYYPFSGADSYTLHRLNTALVSVGDDVPFALYENADTITSGTMLVSLWQDAFLSASVDEAGAYTLPFTEELLPNVILSGAYFDGTRVHAIEISGVDYTSRERELTVSVETDAASYAPGDTATATLHISDTDGNPVSTPFALGIVDNAAFAVMDQYLDPLNSVYAGIYHSSPLQYLSYVDHSDVMRYMAEGGGEGGGGGVRDDFKDTAAFFTGTTDGNGTATLSFTLPDNLTSWRLTATAIAELSGYPYAGKGIASVTTTLPFFLNVVYNEDILTGDDLSLSLRTVGSDISPQYTVTLSGGGVNLTREITGSPSDYTYVNLGTQPAGIYTLTVRAQSGNLSDAVSYPVSVVESRHEIATVSCFSLADGMTIDSLRYPVRLSFCDAADYDTLRALSRASVANNTRLDGALTTVVADSLFYGTDSSASLAAFRDYTGGYRLFPYGDATAETTAWMILADQALVNADSARSYLYSVIYNRSSPSFEVASAYMGLAALGEPVLADVRLLLRSDNGLSVTDKLSLATALALLGDTQGAYTWYEENLDRIGSPDESDEAFTASLHSMLLELTCGHTEAARTQFETILVTPNDRVSPAFALIAYLSRLPASETTDASFSYSMGGKTHTVTFDDSRFFTLTLSQSEMEAADFKLLSGDVGVWASYVAPLTETDDNTNEITVTQTYSDSLSVAGRASLTVRVNLPASIDDALLSIVLPTGMRYVGVPEDYNRNWWVMQEEDGRIRVYLSAKESSDFTVTLNLRCVLPGVFRAEPAVVSDIYGDACAIGGATQVTIQ
ncbi:MAG: Ig-like domain-containing protein [Clostridiaceae bacterium]|nr:Ig-like domain-containing protein [Clostridiaceae bacterium]